MSMKVENVNSQPINHLGIISAIVFNLKIVEEIDARIPVTDRSNVSIGQRVLAMILNGLGFTNQRLYLVPQFFKNKPVEILIGPGIEAEYLNDDCLGRALDAIYEYGTTRLFAEIAFAIAISKNILGKFVHLDTTSLSVIGQYTQNNSDAEDTQAKIIKPTPIAEAVRNAIDNNNSQGQKTPVTITHGHSKDHRPDLKQVVLSMVTTGPAGIPIFMEVLDGNSSDKTSFHNTIDKVSAFQEQLEAAPVFKWVADSALYTKDKLLSYNNSLIWITRVPATLADVKALTEMSDESFEWTDIGSGYKMTSFCSKYGKIQQRWILIFSQQAHDREIVIFERSLLKIEEAVEKELWSFGNTEFACKEDAYDALLKITNKWKYHLLNTVQIEEVLKYEGKGRPKKGGQPISINYKLKCTFMRNELSIQSVRNSKGRFILATNDMELDKNNMYVLTDLEVFTEYKAQSQVENGFRFIKDPWFMVDSIFLKKPERIEALMMIMTLTLLVYNIGQYELREKLKINNDKIPNQVGKEVQNPTLRWVFQLMQDIHIVYIPISGIEPFMDKIVTNITETVDKIIKCFGEHAINIYKPPKNIPTP